MLLALVDIAHPAARLVSWIIIGQVILSWLSFNVLNIIRGACATSSRLDRVIAPIYRPIRRLLPDFGGIDFSPLVLLFLIQVIRKLLAGVVTQYYAVHDREADRRKGVCRAPS